MTMAPTIGRWVRREDGAPKVTGRTVYTGDVKLPVCCMHAWCSAPIPMLAS